MDSMMMDIDDGAQPQAEPSFPNTPSPTSTTISSYSGSLSSTASSSNNFSNGNQQGIQICPICDMVISGKGGQKMIGDHIKEVGHFQCDVCKRSFRDYNGLNQHKSKFHLVGGQLCSFPDCPAPHIEDSSMKALGEHSFDFAHFTCDECGKRFRDENGLIQHESKSHIIGGQICPFPGCPSPQLDNTDLKALGQHSFDLEHYKCLFCQRKYRDQNGLNQHYAKKVCKG
ncbi:hypothetical protein ABKN59_010886 [Abortiporus biennis]